MINGEFVFTLKERKDRDSKLYLFAGINMLNCVLFIRPTGEFDSQGNQTWEAALRPYVKREDSTNSTVDEDSAVWNDSKEATSTKKDPNRRR